MAKRNYPSKIIFLYIYLKLFSYIYLKLFSYIGLGFKCFYFIKFLSSNLIYMSYNTKKKFTRF